MSAAPLAVEDAAAYRQALAVLRRPRVEADDRNPAIAEALDGARSVPLQVARAASDVALLAAEVAECGDPWTAARRVVSSA